MIHSTLTSPSPTSTSKANITPIVAATGVAETSTQTSLPKASKEGLSIGAKAGIIIAALIFGAVIILGGVFWLLRKKKQTNEYRDVPSQSHPMIEEDIGQAAEITRGIETEPNHKWAVSQLDAEKQQIYEAGPGISNRRHELGAPGI